MTTIGTEPQAPDTSLPPPPPLVRWSILVIISLAMFGNYYVYDCISPLADVLVKQLGFTDDNIGWLQAIYSIPNVFMVLIGGILIDRIGVRKATVLFAGLCMVGAFLTAASPSLFVMSSGRLVFGLGAESLIVAVTTAIAKWFRGKELSFAFGINLTIARLGSIAALNSPSWARSSYASWQKPLLIATVFGVICFLSAVVYWFVDAHAAKRYSLGAQSGTDKIVWADLLKFGTSYWYVVALCITFYSAIFPFQTFAVKFFMDVHGVSREEGGFLSSLLTIAAAFGTPAFGILVDRVGKRSLLMIFGSILLIPVYLVMAYTKVSLYVPMAVMGIAFALIPAVMWPSVAYLVPEEKLGTGYGLMTLIQNVGLAGFNFVIGKANTVSQASETHPDGYRMGMWIFSSLGFFGLLFAWLLRRRETGPDAHGLETITTTSRK